MRIVAGDVACWNHDASNSYQTSQIYKIRSHEASVFHMFQLFSKRKRDGDIC